MLRRRATVLMMSGPRHDPDRKHLFVLLTNPCLIENSVLMVVISSRRPNYDPSCELNVGDHEFVRHPSFVEYAHGRIQLVAGLERGLRDGTLHEKAEFAAAIFQRICAGLVASPFTAKRLITYYQNQLKAMLRQNGPQGGV